MWHEGPHLFAARLRDLIDASGPSHRWSSFLSQAASLVKSPFLTSAASKEYFTKRDVAFGTEVRAPLGASEATNEKTPRRRKSETQNNVDETEDAPNGEQN